MCTASSTAIGMTKIGIIELMMWTVLPVAMSRPMAPTTDTRATTIGANTRFRLRKKSHMRSRIRAIAAGAEIAICQNISTPN